MQKHPWFNLQLHTDDELSVLLGSSITQRVTLHEWPLSCVQRIETVDEQRWIYKTQSGPSVEAQFYAQARSNLLVTARTIYQQDGDVILLLEPIDAPLMEDLNLSAESVLQLGSELQGAIAAIQGNIPVLFDVSSPDKWRSMVTATLDQLRTLVAGGQFQQVTLDMLAALQQRALSGAVLAVTQQPQGLVHGDLTGDNLFILPDGGYRLIDWARPFWGSAAVDLAALLESLGHDPLSQVESSVVTMLYMLRINWLTQCAARWFPAGVATYDEQIAGLIGQITSL